MKNGEKKAETPIKDIYSIFAIYIHPNIQINLAIVMLEHTIYVPQWLRSKSINDGTIWFQ